MLCGLVIKADWILYSLFSLVETFNMNVAVWSEPTVRNANENVWKQQSWPSYVSAGFRIEILARKYITFEAHANCKMWTRQIFYYFFNNKLLSRLIGQLLPIFYHLGVSIIPAINKFQYQMAMYKTFRWDNYCKRFQDFGLENRL